jgi:hypothetical protein
MAFKPSWNWTLGPILVTFNAKTKGVASHLVLGLAFLNQFWLSSLEMLLGNLLTEALGVP